MKTKQVAETVNQSLRKLEEIETVNNQIKNYERRKRSIEMHKQKIQERSDYIEEYFQNPKILTLAKTESLKNQVIDHLAHKHNASMQKRIEDFEKQQLLARQDQLKAVQQVNLKTMIQARE